MDQWGTPPAQGPSPDESGDGGQGMVGPPEQGAVGGTPPWGTTPSQPLAPPPPYQAPANPPPPSPYQTLPSQPLAPYQPGSYGGPPTSPPAQTLPPYGQAQAGYGPYGQPAPPSMPYGQPGYGGSAPPSGGYVGYAAPSMPLAAPYVPPPQPARSGMGAGAWVLTIFASVLLLVCAVPGVLILVSGTGRHSTSTTSYSSFPTDTPYTSTYSMPYTYPTDTPYYAPPPTATPVPVPPQPEYQQYMTTGSNYQQVGSAFQIINPHIQFGANDPFAYVVDRGSDPIGTNVTVGLYARGPNDTERPLTSSTEALSNPNYTELASRSNHMSDLMGSLPPGHYKIAVSTPKGRIAVATFDYLG